MWCKHRGQRPIQSCLCVFACWHVFVAQQQTCSSLLLLHQHTKPAHMLLRPEALSTLTDGPCCVPFSPRHVDDTHLAPPGTCLSWCTPLPTPCTPQNTHWFTTHPAPAGACPPCCTVPYLPLAPTPQKQKIRDKYEPGAADLRAYKRAKAEGRLAEYWAERGETLRQLTGSAEPPTTSVAASG